MEIIIIAAISENHVIGKENTLIWHLPNDFKRFKRVTTGYPIIMGRKTFDSLDGKPLPNRQNIVITSQKKIDNSAIILAKSLEEAIEKAKVFGKEKVYILGGGQIFSSAMNIADKLDITKVHETFLGDTFFPPIDQNIWQLESEEKHLADDKHLYAYSFCLYKRK